MSDYAHPRTHRERKVCPYMQAASSTTRPPPPRNSKMEHKTNKGVKNARRKPHTTKGKHNTHKNKKQKLNIHNMHKRQQPHRPPRHKCTYVTCRATLRNEHGIRTTTTPTKVTTRCNRDVPTPSSAHVPTPARTPAYIGSERERKACPPVHAAASATRPPPPRTRKKVWGDAQDAKNDEKDARREPHTTTRKNNTQLQKHKNHTCRATRNAQR